MLDQSDKIGSIPYLINSPTGFINVQSKEEAFKIWKQKGILCPNYFSFNSIKDFYRIFEKSGIRFPFLIRINNDVAGKGSYLVKGKFDLLAKLFSLVRIYKNNIKKILE